jgi:hypothetical protein
MPHPVTLITQITEITKECFGWTHLADVDAISERDGYKGQEWVESVGNPNGLAGLSPVSWWLTPDAFIKVWTDLGWTCVYTTPPTPHVNGSLAAQFWASGQPTSKNFL